MEEEKGYFTVKSGVYARRLFAITLSRLWWVPAVPVIVFFLLACYDSRFLYVAFMWLMIVSPGILAIAYFRWALAPEISIKLIPQRLSKSAEGFTIEYRAQPEDRYTPPSEFVSNDEIVAVEDNGEYTTIYLSRSPYSIIIVPSAVAANLELA